MAIHGNNYDYSNYGWNFKMVTFFNEKIRYFKQIIKEFKVNVQGVIPNFIFTQYMQVTDPMHHASKNSRRRIYQYNEDDFRFPF